MNRKFAATAVSVLLDSTEAGKEVVVKALSKMEGWHSKQPGILFLFAGGRQNVQKVFEGAQAALKEKDLGQVKILGGSTIGIVTDDFLGYENHEVAGLLLKEDGWKTHLFSHHGLKQLGEKKAGEQLSQQIQGVSNSLKHLWVVYDSIKTSRAEGIPELFYASYLFEGLSASFPKWPDTAGLGVFSDNEQGPCYVIHPEGASRHSAWIYGVSGDIEAHTIVMHGCMPSGGQLKVTKSEGARIFEINHRPAVAAVGELLGADGADRIIEFPLMLTFGIETASGEYITRLTIHADKQTGALSLFEPIPEGSEMTLMTRSLDFDYMKNQMGQLFKTLDADAGRKYLFATYINCGGRAKLFAGTPTEEAAEVQKIVGSKMPLLGLYTGVEVAILNNKPVPLDLSGVLTIFSKK